MGATVKIKGHSSTTTSIQIPKVKKKNIEEIQVVKLDEGSDNSGANKKMGMVYGIEYTLKVMKYKNNQTPSNLNTIKWSYSYPTDDGLVVGEITETGEEITFEANNLDLCGKKLTFYGFITSKEEEANLEVFHHYRFRWFDRTLFETELKSRKNRPKLIQQNSTSLCGIACLAYSFLKRDKEGYETFALTLHEKGKAEYNNYKIEPEEHFFETSPKDSDYPNNWKGTMPSADWIVMASIRNNENSSYDGKDGEDWDAINWPWVMENLGQNFLGANTIKNQTYSISNFSKDKTYELKEMQKLHSEGYQVMMMIDADMLDNETSTFGFVNHWISFIGGYSFDEKEKEHKFKIFTWGDTKTLNISKKAFNTNSYGYIALK